MRPRCTKCKGFSAIFPAKHAQSGGHRPSQYLHTGQWLSGEIIVLGGRVRSLMPWTLAFVIGGFLGNPRVGELSVEGRIIGPAAPGAEFKIARYTLHGRDDFSRQPQSG